MFVISKLYIFIFLILFRKIYSFYEKSCSHSQRRILDPHHARLELDNVGFVRHAAYTCNVINGQAKSVTAGRHYQGWDKATIYYLPHPHK